MKAATSWAEENQRYVSAALRQLSAIIAGGPVSMVDCEPPDEIAASMERPPAPRVLATAFGLSPFESDLLLLTAGVELDSEFARAVRSAGEGAGAAGPAFGMALALLPGAHWSALAPSSPLRRWRLVETTADASLTQGPLRAAERVIHFLAGVQTLDTELEGMVTIAAGPPELGPTHAEIAARAVRALTAPAIGEAMPLVQLLGRVDAARDVAAAVAGSLGLNLAVIQADHVPAPARECEQLARLWEREAVLSGLLLLLDCTSLREDSPAASAVVRFAEQVVSPVLTLSRTPLAGLQRSDVRLTVQPPSLEERIAAWRALMPAAPPELDIERIATQFHLNVRDIRSATTELSLREDSSGGQATALWELCRERSRPQLDHLSDRVLTTAAWDDLVLPEQQKQVLREIASHARVRNRVYSTWGFGGTSPRGLGITALFAGPSGTGKTMAAEALSEELRLDMYRIDLGRVVSKYIGETEKNLGRIFEEAEAGGGVILLFDEADALFGKRTEVRDSHDRYANLEVSYLLQRMEAYEGLAILTTNLKSALDPAFLRRLRFVVQFPFPDVEARTQIWRGAFPAATPVSGLNFERLARLNVAGGNIRNIALNAAFSAAASDEPVTMAHILGAARSEYAKLERPLSDAETRGWL